MVPHGGKGVEKLNRHMKAKHPQMDVALVPQLQSLDDHSLEMLAALYARWSRQIRALARYKKEHEERESRRRAGDFLTAKEKRYCEMEGIPAAEWVKSKGI